jgi:hypothetical protein
MSIAKRGARTITVDGTSYLWRIRRRGTHGQDCYGAPMRIGIQSVAQGARGVLVVNTAITRPDAAIYGHGGGVTPAQIRDMIRQALAAGWEPMTCGMDLRYGLYRDHIGRTLPPRGLMARKLSPKKVGARRSRPTTARLPPSPTPASRR